MPLPPAGSRVESLEELLDPAAQPARAAPVAGPADDLGLDLDPRRGRARRRGRNAGAPTPSTTSSSPASSSSSHAGGSRTETGTDIARPSTRVVTCSWASRWSDGSTRSSGGLEHAPRTMATLNDSASIDNSPVSRRVAPDDSSGEARGKRGARYGEGVTATIAATTAASSAQRGESLGDVGEAGVVATDAQEQLARLRDVARAFVEVGRARTRPGRGAPARDSALPPRRSSVAIASVQTALVGARAGEHDAALR